MHVLIQNPEYPREQEWQEDESELQKEQLRVFLRVCDISTLHACCV